MEVISKANELVLKILRKPKNTDRPRRLLRFCVETVVDDGVLLFNLLTKELLLLSREEYDHILDNDYLWEHWFVVPEDLNDKEYVQLAKWVVSTRQEKNKDITSYVIFPTTDCNARCFYCFELGRSRIPMSRETALKVVQYIKDHCGGKKVNLSWFGGEPLFNQEAIDTICTGLRQEGIEFSSFMVSNAYLFDDATVKKAVELWNLKRIQVTLDGTEEVYNKVKAYIYKEGNPYEIVLRNMEYLLDASINIAVRLNMDMHNADNLLELADELSQRFGGKKGIYVYAHHIFKNNESMADMHTEEEWQVREEAMDRLFEKLVQSGLAGKAGIPKGLKLTRCMADSGKSVTILPDGNIGLCEHFSESEFIGHIDREGFDEDMVASWKETIPEIEECATCFYYPECVMLKKCSNENKCFPQYRAGFLRSTKWKMECEYKKWKTKQEQTEEEEVVC